MNHLPLKKINDEVFLATDDVVKFDKNAVHFIKEMALNNSRGRSRICAHKNANDNLHEMLIAIRADSYIRPHRHHNKIESFHLIEGRADIIIMTDDGEIKEVVALGQQHNFYYRLATPYYHTLLIHSPVLVIHEITNGPFNAMESDFAAFAPEEGAVNMGKYVDMLRNQVSKLSISN